MKSLRRQKGVALMMAMLIVALAVIMATQIGFDSALEQKRTVTALTLEQAFQVGMGAEAWAGKFLQDDLRSDMEQPPAQDHLAEDWARPMPPIPIDGGQIEGALEDLQGKFNVNNLTDDPNKRWYRSFQHLLAALELEPKWADVLVDWLDNDNQAISADGAEDDTYTSMTPPYRAANTQITSISELLAMPDFGLERYNKIKPYISALPRGTLVNVCSAPGIVLDSLTEEGIQEYSLNQDAIARDRKDKCFPQVDTLRQVYPSMDGMITDRSEYFRLNAFITIGGIESSLYSLLYRKVDGDGRVRALMRSFGNE